MLEDISRPDLPIKLFGDHIRLKQVLINLVKNALKFTMRGKIQIVMAYDNANKLLKVHVKDNGKGIMASDMDLLFKQFGKLRRTATMNSEGIGMGLMICRTLVQKNGGTISVHSDGIDKGSIFTFTMYMKNPEEGSPLIKERGAGIDRLIREDTFENDDTVSALLSKRSQLLPGNDNMAAEME